MIIRNNGSEQHTTSGFTLIEILTVVGIIGLIVGSIIVVAAGATRRAMTEGTKGMLQKISIALQEYHNEFREYPPDGYDFPVTALDGSQIKGSACLTYFLAWKYSDGSDYKSFDLKKVDYTDPNNPRQVDANGNEPFLQELQKEDLNRFGELIDKWRNPIRYDNCERTKDGTVLYSSNVQPIDGAKDPDPRQVTNNSKSFNPGEYDLWSCGKDGNTDESNADNDIISGSGEVK
jgi:type II secretory pathway pseudopilin PulG